jgi:hypothetical protein
VNHVSNLHSPYSTGNSLNSEPTDSSSNRTMFFEVKSNHTVLSREVSVFHTSNKLIVICVYASTNSRSICKTECSEIIPFMADDM